MLYRQMDIDFPVGVINLAPRGVLDGKISRRTEEISRRIFRLIPDSVCRRACT